MKDNAQISAGVAEVAISPPADAPSLGTIQCCTGIHDDLFARALVLADGVQQFAIVSLDLIGLDFEQSDAIRKSIQERSEIVHVVLHCTHNHSAPFNIPWSVLGPRWVAGPGRSWRDSLPEKIAGLVALAKTRLEPVLLSSGRAPAHIGTNRRTLVGGAVVMKPNLDGPVVPWVDVLCVERRN